MFNPPTRYCNSIGCIILAIISPRVVQRQVLGWALLSVRSTHPQHLLPVEHKSQGSWWFQVLSTDVVQIAISNLVNVWTLNIKHTNSLKVMMLSLYFISTVTAKSIKHETLGTLWLCVSRDIRLHFLGTPCSAQPTSMIFILITITNLNIINVDSFTYSKAVCLSKVWTTGGLWQNRSSSCSTKVTPLFALCKMQIFDRKSSGGRPVGRQGAIWDDVFAIFDPHVFLNRFSSHKHVQMQINLNLFGKWRKV